MAGSVSRVSSSSALFSGGSAPSQPAQLRHVLLEQGRLWVSRSASVTGSAEMFASDLPIVKRSRATLPVHFSSLMISELSWWCRSSTV